MRYADWKNLPEEDRRRLCQQLNAMEDWDLFKQVERAFLAEFGGHDGVDSAFCGIGGTVGPLNAIVVSMRAGARRTRLPEQFMGFPVVRGRRAAEG